MPHLIIEYSDNVAGEIDIQALVDRVHDVATAHELPPDIALRTRAVGRHHYRIADGDPRYAFVAFTARIGPGRPQPMKDDFLQLMLNTIENFLDEHAPTLIVALSGEVQEIDPIHRINRNHIRTHRESQQ